MATVFILLPAHNRREITRRCVDCIAAQTLRDHLLVLLDDGSTDGTAGMVRARIPGAVVLTGPGDWWWAGALQHGYQWLRARGVGPDDFVLITNDDTEFDPGFLETGVALLRERPRTLLLAQAHDLQTGALLEAGMHVDWRRLAFRPATSPAEVNCLSTRGLFVRATEFLALGGFRPRLLPHYFSDYEFTLRAARRGWRMLTDPSLALRVDTSATGFRDYSGLTFREFLSRYFSMRSTMNPLAWTSFVALACPWPWKALHFLTVWRNAAITILLAAWRAARARGG